MDGDISMNEKDIIKLSGRELDAVVHREVFGKEAVWIPEDDNALFGGAVFTRDRDWLVNDYLDPEENTEIPHYHEMCVPDVFVEQLSKLRYKKRYNGVPAKYIRLTVTHSKQGWKANLLTDAFSYSAKGSTFGEAVSRVALLAVRDARSSDES